MIVSPQWLKRYWLGCKKLERLGYVYLDELNSLNWQNKKIKYSNIVEESEKDKKLLMDEKNKYEAELKKLKIF